MQHNWFAVVKVTSRSVDGAAQSLGVPAASSARSPVALGPGK